MAPVTNLPLLTDRLSEARAAVGTSTSGGGWLATLSRTSGRAGTSCGSFSQQVRSHAMIAVTGAVFTFSMLSFDVELGDRREQA